ncbi:hypothetical protein VitviT2T_027573 [Vitis vinifera]|uniref:EF-hand domain-containing protein n=1 Tax=Vitis vinifera TaxID=29760 RepID=A0ABY9DQS5_VITVI|nr:hypothetical protein VitviT2T_027573 [Vitis vinifera]
MFDEKKSSNSPILSTSKSKSKRIKGEKVQQIFKKHDANGDGSLSLEELATAYGELGSIIPNLRAHLSLFHADTNGDGKINSEEMESLINYAMSLGYRIK